MSFGEEDDELNCTLWVGNLDPKISESALFDIFVQGGPIEKIHIPKGKDGSEHKASYAFITFQHNESVPYTMQVLDGTSLYGKVLKLQPRPGSKHKKLMDAAKESDHRQLVQQQQLQMPVPATQLQVQGQPQWFLAPPHPQMAQFQNMLLYQNQMFQAYSPCLPNLNNGMAPTLVQLPSGMTTHLIPLPVQPPLVGGTAQQQQPFPLEQQYPYHHQYQRGPRPSGEYRNSRPTRGMANGYAMHRHPNGSSAQLPSQYSQTQVLNGSQSQSLRFPQPNRGPRPHVQRPLFQNQQQQPATARNSNNVNGNARPTFPQRSQAPAFQASPPLVYTAPMYRHQSPPAVGGAPLQYQPQPNDRQFFQRPPFPAGDAYTY